MAEREGRDGRFVRYLTGLADREERGALAALRRGLGKPPGEAPEMYPYVAPWTQDERGWREQVLYLVAALFALHPVNWGRGEDGRPNNFGASMARAAEGEEGIERRFVALLNSNQEDLPEHLRHAVSLCRAKQVPVDWAALLHDLRSWGGERRWVQRDWARAFWRAPQGQEAETTA